MISMGIESKIQNSKLLTYVFGYWPSFHDAQVLNIALETQPPYERPATLKCAIYVFEITSQIDETGHYVLRHRVVVNLRFDGFTNLRIEGFENFNSLSGLKVIDISNRQLQ